MRIAIMASSQVDAVHPIARLEHYWAVADFLAGANLG